MKPLLSKRWITSPTSRRCTPSGFTATRVRSWVQEGPPVEEGGSGLPWPHLSHLLDLGSPAKTQVSPRLQSLPQPEQSWRGIMVPTARTVQHGGPLGTSACRRAMAPPRQAVGEAAHDGAVPLRCHTGKKVQVLMFMPVLRGASIDTVCTPKLPHQGGPSIHLLGPGRVKSTFPLGHRERERKGPGD